MAMLNVNGKTTTVDAEPDTPLLWVLREQLGLTGTKYGCGIAQCGACTVHVDGAPLRSCVVPVASIADAGLLPRRRPAACRRGLAGKPVLSAQQIEDVVAYLRTLRD